MSARIVVLAGDGVGPEVTAAAVRVLEQVSAGHALKLEFENALIGGAAYDAAGSPLPDATVAACKASKGILLGAVGGPKWADIPVQHRPEQGLLAIRKALGLFANLRPVTTTPELAAASPLKPEKLKGVDILVIRELTGGIYFGKRSRMTRMSTPFSFSGFSGDAAASSGVVVTGRRLANKPSALRIASSPCSGRC